MMMFLNRGCENNFRKLSTQLGRVLLTAVTERKHSSSFISASNYSVNDALFRGTRFICNAFSFYQPAWV